MAAAADIDSYRREMSGAPIQETALYRPVKTFLEARGFEVKAEVCGCACRGDEPPVIVELKLRFNLALVLQGIDRLRLTDRVYLAVARPPYRARGLSPETASVRRLCRRLGLGLMIVGRRGDGVLVLEEPGPNRPRLACRAAWRDRPEPLPAVVEHLKAKAITPDYDDHGWIRWPLEQHASP